MPCFQLCQFFLYAVYVSCNYITLHFSLVHLLLHFLAFESWQFQYFRKHLVLMKLTELKVTSFSHTTTLFCPL